MDQQTRKISASQLASVLAKADAELAADIEEEQEPARENVSGARPAAGEPPPAPAVPEVLAIVERPVGDAKVVNVTSPETPAHSSGRIPAAAPASAEPKPEPEARADASEAAADAEPAAPPRKYASLPVRLPVQSSRFGVALVVLLFAACCVVLVWFDH